MRDSDQCSGEFCKENTQEYIRPCLIDAILISVSRLKSAAGVERRFLVSDIAVFDNKYARRGDRNKNVSIKERHTKTPLKAFKNALRSENL